MLIFNFITFIILGRLLGNISLVNIWNLDALNALNILIFSLSVLLKLSYIFMVATITDINNAIIMMDVIFAPNHIIIIGPNATLGKLFKIVKYGSIISAILFFHHKIDAINSPKKVPNEKLIIVSYTVIKICLKRLFDLYSS